MSYFNIFLVHTVEIQIYHISLYNSKGIAICNPEKTAHIYRTDADLTRAITNTQLICIYFWFKTSAATSFQINILVILDSLIRHLSDKHYPMFTFLATIEGPRIPRHLSLSSLQSSNFEVHSLKMKASFDFFSIPHFRKSHT